MPKDKQEYIITVMARDRPGIVAGIGEAIYKLGGNIEELSQTVVRGYFTIIVSATFSNILSCEEVRDAVAATGTSDELEVAVRLRKSSEPLSATPSKYDSFVLTLFGKDKLGVIYNIASYLASHGINITDLYGKTDDNSFTMVLELSVPPEIGPSELKTELEELGRSFGMSAHFQHVDLFKATHELHSLTTPVPVESRKA